MNTDLGVVLKTTPLRESDLLVVLYTATHGRVSAVARGARKSQRRFAGALQLLVLGRYQLGRSRGELWNLESGEVEREWTQLSSDVFAVAHASYIAELVASLLPAEVPEPHALDVMVALWESLAEAGPSPAALRAVELELLDIAGHRPALEACAACGATDLETGAMFDPTHGGAICKRCAATSRGANIRHVDAGTLGYLAAIARGAAALPSADVAAGRQAAVAGAAVLLLVAVLLSVARTGRVV